MLTTGTFLSGLIHVGLQNYEAGRAGDPPAKRLGARLRELKLPVGRLKTGTPPRLDGRTIDFSALERRSPATIRRRCSRSSGRATCIRGSCRAGSRTPTRARTTSSAAASTARRCSPASSRASGRAIARRSRTRSCASRSATATRSFSSRKVSTRHEIYPNGISTSLPFDVQLALVRSMKGCEHAHILRPGYCDRVRLLRSARRSRPRSKPRRSAGCSSPGRSTARPATKKPPRRACWPASTPRASSRGEDGWCPRRDEAYLGVLVDDLITRGVAEPYRMFTSRAEYRLQLREDNADLRLTEPGRALGLVDDARWDAFCRKRDAVARELERLKSTFVNPQRRSDDEAERVLGQRIEREYALADLLRRPGVTYASLMTLPGAGEPVDDPAVAEQVEIATKYAGYIDRQQRRDRSATRAGRRCRSRRPRLPRRARAVDRSAAEAQRATAGNARPGGAHLRASRRRRSRCCSCT